MCLSLLLLSLACFFTFTEAQLQTIQCTIPNSTQVLSVEQFFQFKFFSCIEYSPHPLARDFSEVQCFSESGKLTTGIVFKDILVALISPTLYVVNKVTLNYSVMIDPFSAGNIRDYHNSLVPSNLSTIITICNLPCFPTELVSFQLACRSNILAASVKSSSSASFFNLHQLTFMMMVFLLCTHLL